MKSDSRPFKCSDLFSQSVIPYPLNTCSTMTICSNRSEAYNQSDNLSQPNVYEGFFQAVKCPAFIIDVASGSLRSRPYLLNSEAAMLVKSCNGNFYSDSYLEKFDGTLKDFISNIKTKETQEAFYSDIIRLPSPQELKIIYRFNASVFRLDKENKLLGIMLVEISKEMKDRLSVLEDFKASLTSSLSHELMNPINSLMPLLDMMPSYIKEDNKEDVKEMALFNATILKNKIRDLIDYTKMEINNIKLDFKQFYLDELFDELKKLFTIEMKSKSNIFTTEIASYSNKRLKIFADRNRLRQILIKLISNANKFTYKGFISLTAKEIKENFNVLFIVTDTGIGMTKEKQNLLLIPLSHKSANHNEFAKLSGLGLEVAKGLCKCMDSKLMVSSEEGRGSKFTFEIPVCRISTFDDLVALDAVPRKESLIIFEEKDRAGDFLE